VSKTTKTKAELLEELEDLRARLLEQKRECAGLKTILKEMASVSPAATVRRSRETAEEEQIRNELAQSHDKLQDAYEELQVAEEELRQQNEGLIITRLETEKERNRYQGLFESAPDGYLVTDTNGVIREANRLVEVMFNFPRQELSGKPLLNFVAEERHREFMTRLSKFKDLSVSQTWELRIQPREHTPFDAEITVAQAYDPSDRDTIIRWLIRDISERKQAEEALRQSSNTLQAVFDSASSGIVVADANARFLLANANADRILGSPVTGDAYGPTDGYRFSRLDGTPIPRGQTPLSLALKGQVVRDMELLVIRSDGTQIVVLANVTPLRSDDGRLWGAVSVFTDITERKQIEKALARERELLQRIFDNIPVMLVLWDSRLQSFSLNRHAEAVMGWTSAEANDGDFMSKLYPDPAYRAKAIAYMESLEAGWREWVVTTKDGGRVPTAWANIRLTDDSMIGIGVDLRERKQAEEALRQANERLDIAQRAAEAGIWDRDITTGTLEWSPKMFELFGLDPHKTKASFEAWDSVLHPEDREKAHSRVGEAIRQHTFMDNVYRIIRPDGQTRWINALGQCIYDEQGNPLRTSGICIDITERKQVEEALRKTTARLKAALDASGGAIYDHRVQLDESTYHDDRWAEMLGYDPEELPPYDRFLDWLYEQVHPEDLDLLKRAYADFVEGKAPGYHVEIRLRHKQGHWVWVEGYSHATERDETGRVRRVVGMMTDITKRKQAEIDLRESEARFQNLSRSLEEKVKQKTDELLQAEHLAAIGQMVSTVAHEIRNPIQIIKAGVDFFRQPSSRERERQEILDEIEYGAKMLEGTIADLLQYARPLTLEFSFIPIKDVVEGALRLVADKMKNVDAHIELERGDEEINVDAVKFTQVIANILSNAADAMPGGGSLSISSTVLERDEARLLEISITDTGHGIDEAHLQDIFKPFFTTKMRGTGLGLSLCKKIMDAHGGTISIKSKLGEGTTVELTLPINGVRLDT
jgi:PAS domain S-box-containing protein